MENYTLIGLFFTALVSSTILPGGSEAVLIYLGQQEVHSSLALWSIASIGNTIGGLLTWGLGWWLATKKPIQSFNLKVRTQQSLERIRRWGSPALVFSWIPVIGDPLCLAAGLLRIGFLPALLFIVIGKSLRYYFVISVI